MPAVSKLYRRICHLCLRHVLGIQRFQEVPAKLRNFNYKILLISARDYPASNDIPPGAISKAVICCKYYELEMYYGRVCPAGFLEGITAED